MKYEKLVVKFNNLNLEIKKSKAREWGMMEGVKCNSKENENVGNEEYKESRGDRGKEEGREMPPLRSTLSCSHSPSLSILACLSSCLPPHLYDISHKTHKITPVMHQLISFAPQTKIIN